MNICLLSDMLVQNSFKEINFKHFPIPKSLFSDKSYFTTIQRLYHSKTGNSHDIPVYPLQNGKVHIATFTLPIPSLFLISEDLYVSYQCEEIFTDYFKHKFIVINLFPTSQNINRSYF